MEQMLKRLGMSDTRFQLKYGTPSDLKMSSKNQYPEPDSKRQNNTSRICKCKETQKSNNRQIIYSNNNKASNQKSAQSFFKSSQGASHLKIFSNSKIQGMNNKTQTINNFNKNIFKSESNKFQDQSNRKKQVQKVQSLKKSTNKNQTNNKNSTQQQQTLLFDLFTKHQMHQTQKLKQIVFYLRKKLSHKCVLPDHQHNRILYVCLQPNCQNRIGCSYCFLHNHEKHLKSEIDTCIKDLQELIFKVKANQKLYQKKISIFYEEFVQKLQTEIKNIKQQFQCNLEFLRMKIKKEFQSYFTNKYSSYVKGNEIVSQFQISDHLKNQSVNFDMEKTLRFEDSKKLSSFNQTAKKQEDQKQKEALTNLAYLDFQQIYNFLRNRLQVLHFQVAESNILIQYFQEFNSSVTHMYSAFKRNIPKILNQQKLNIQKPHIINFT